MASDVVSDVGLEELANRVRRNAGLAASWSDAHPGEDLYTQPWDEAMEEVTRAVDELAGLADGRAPALLARLAMEVHLSRRAIGDALPKLRGAEAVDAIVYLIDNIESHNFLRVDAIKALGRFGEDAKAIAALKRAAKEGGQSDAARRARGEAIEMLENLRR